MFFGSISGIFEFYLVYSEAIYSSLAENDRRWCFCSNLFIWSGVELVLIARYFALQLTPILCTRTANCDSVLNLSHTEIRAAIQPRSSLRFHCVTRLKLSLRSSPILFHIAFLKTLFPVINSNQSCFSSHYTHSQKSHAHRTLVVTSSRSNSCPTTSNEKKSYAMTTHNDRRMYSSPTPTPNSFR